MSYRGCGGNCEFFTRDQSFVIAFGYQDFFKFSNFLIF
jgi:hypothetical protein